MGFLRDGLSAVARLVGQRQDGSACTFLPLSAVEIENLYRGSGIMRKAIDIPAFDAVREWRDWRAEQDQIEAIEAEERRLGARAKVRQAEILRGLGGGAIILGAPGDTQMPINPRAGTGSLAYLAVVSRHHLTLGEIVQDPTSPLFGGPAQFEMRQASGETLKFHPSRVVCFKGDPLPALAGVSADDAFWGDSRVARLRAAVANSDSAQTGFASLIRKARYTRVGIPGLGSSVSTAAGEAKLAQRFGTMAELEGMTGVTVFDAGSEGKGGESITDYQVSWTGMPEIMTAFDRRVAAVADIPMTRMFGTAAEGMNASGDSQNRDYNKHVRARQELDMRPCLEQIDVALIPSALGARPAELWWEFSPLDTLDETQEATRFKTTMDAVEKLQATATIPDVAFAKGVQNLMSEAGWMPGLDGALAELPENERFGLVSDDEEGGDPLDLAGGAGDDGSVPARRAANDAKPRPLYVQRKLLNAPELIAWAKEQGFGTTTPAEDVHVTITYSRAAVDWMKMGETWSGKDGELIVEPGGARIVEALGDKGAVVLLFASSTLSWRHEEMVRAGASFDFPEYQPHVTITYSKPDGLDLASVEPFRGALHFGPELFQELDTDFKPGEA